MFFKRAVRLVRPLSASQRGAVLPLLALGLVGLLLTTLLLVGLSARVTNQATAQSAADAAALAGVMDGRRAAAELAAANGAELVKFDAGTNEVRVVVVVNGRRAEARAERRLSVDPGS